MAKNNNSYRLSDSFVKFLTESSGGFLTGEDFENLIEQLEKNAEKFIITNLSEANLRRIISALFDRKTFLLEALKFDHHLEIVCAISSYSNYLTDIIVRNPEYLYLIFDQDFLTSKIDQQKLIDGESFSLTKFKKFGSKTRFLRNLKRKNLLKIGVADILDLTDLKEVTAEISKLANVISTLLFEICCQEVENKYNILLERNFALCSLGKLGGNELNYSSDIDLILFYENNYVIKSVNKEYHELITEVLQLFIQEATKVTPESYIYRVDFRLRPDGRNSLLTRTLSDYLIYYETRGEEWERQMLIKLNFVCGDEELYYKFKNFLTGFIFPKSFSRNILSTIKKMKQTIEVNSDDEQNIKLSVGGIRDIEFSVQALQLINGGRKSNLRTGNTLEAINELTKENLLTNEESNILSEAYILFRKVEHFVQLMNDKQTHSIPSEGDTLYKLFRYLGYENESDFTGQIAEIRQKVRTIYNNILSVPGESNHETIENVRFSNTQKAKKNFQFLARGVSLIGEKQFDKNTVNAFGELEPNLIDLLKESADPDLILENFTRVIKNSKIPSVWYKSFEDRLFLKSFIKLCLLNQRAIDSLSTSPKLADHFLSKKVFLNDTKSITSFELDQLTFSLCVQHSLSLIEFPKFSKLLVMHLESKISEIVSKHNINYKFFLAGLGSFGNLELSFGSDIDLIVVVEDLKKANDAEQDFQGLLKIFRHQIPQFEVDFRLRPEGKNSPLVIDIEGYKKYINNRMRVWEFQALSKINFICGNENLFIRFINIRNQRFREIESSTIIENTLAAYKANLNFGISSNKKMNLKSNSGALLTVDTIVQLILMLDQDLYNESYKLSCIEKLKLASTKIDAEFKEDFVVNYIYLKNAQIAVHNFLNQKKSTLTDDRNKITLLAKSLNEDNVDIFIEKLKSIMYSNTKLYNKIKSEYEAGKKIF